MDGNIKLFTGNANLDLARSVANYMNVPLGDALVDRFSDGEVQVEIHTSVRDNDVFVLQSLSEPVNDHLMELLAMTDAIRRSSAESVTAVIPYFGYARQDRQPKPRTPITAKLVADVLEVSGISRVVAVDLHASQIQGFFTQPFEHLYASPVFISAIRDRGFDSEEMVLVSPDAGGVDRVRYYSKVLGCPIAIMDKRRSAPNASQMMNVIGDVESKRAIIVDDMVDTAGTLTQAAAALMERGAESAYAVATHPILSGPAIERIETSPLDTVLVTDTIPLTPAARECNTIDVVSVGPLLGEAIGRIHGGDSVSSIFDEHPQIAKAEN
ncbi:MAG: ribose-phosphate pyrophosphokinase [Bradymonadaceae bacterium]